MGARLDGDGASLDPICISEHATEQFIPQKENALNSDGDKPVTELRLVLDSVDPWNLSGINEDSGEGANAVSRAEMMITVSASPLSELVWSPHGGLSLKCTDCSSSDKSSVLWNTNLGRMIVLPLQSIKDNTNGDNATTAKGTLGLTQTGFGPENEISKRASSTKSSQSNMDIIPMCISRPTEKKYEVLGINSKAAITDINIEREMGKTSPGEKKANTCISGDRKEMAGTCLGKTSLPGQSNEKVTIVIKQGALPEHSSQVPYDEIGNVEWNNKVKGPKEIFLSKDYSLKSYDHCKGPILNLITEEDSKLAKALSNSIELPHLDRLKPCAENEVENIRTEENNETTKQNKDIPILDNKLRVESSAASDDRRPLALRKGKGKALSDTMIEQSQSNGKTASHESVESSNNCELFSSRKRAWSFEKKIVIGSKKIKRQDSSKKIKRQGSSFMTWISNMTNGFQKFETGENLSLSVMPKTSQRRHGSRDSLSVSHDKNQDQALKNTGFQSVFRALRGPSLSLQERNSELEESDRKRFLCDSVKTQMADCEGHVKSSNFILPSNRHSTFLPDVTGFPEKYETKFKNCNSGKVSGLLKGVVPYLDSSFLEKPDSQKVKEASKICAADLSYSKSMTNKPAPLNSLWITRFSPKVLNSVQFNTSSNAAVDGCYDSNRVFPCNVEQNNLEGGHGQKPEKQTIALGRNLDDYSVGPTSSCNSRRTNVDQKLKSKVSSILPSERSKISEALTSVFARRVDALRRIMPSKDEDDVTHETICFFCGLKGHTLRDCSEMGESDRNDLLKNLKLWDEGEDTSCLCILCFKLNHWAVSCPYSSSRKSLGGENYKKMSEERWNKIPQSDLDGQILHRHGNEVADCQQVTSYATTCGKFLTMDTELNVCSNGVKESSTTGKPSGKHLGSNFENPGLKDNQVSLLCNTKDMSDVPRATFEAIRKLRLSRRDILRWIKSPIPNLRLEGFFLRLRLGKWEEGLGGTGYHVACISGASYESSSRTSKTPISVDIGGFKCPVDCHSVSNHDFNEDELMAWWCAILRGDGKQPSEEQLHIKLQERQKYGF